MVEPSRHRLECVLVERKSRSLKRIKIATINRTSIITKLRSMSLIVLLGVEEFMDRFFNFMGVLESKEGKMTTTLLKSTISIWWISLLFRGSGREKRQSVRGGK